MLILEVLVTPLTYIYYPVFNYNPSISLLFTNLISQFLNTIYLSRESLTILTTIILHPIVKILILYDNLRTPYFTFYYNTQYFKMKHSLKFFLSIYFIVLLFLHTIYKFFRVMLIVICNLKFYD